jgi:hypothetical protein
MSGLVDDAGNVISSSSLRQEAHDEFQNIAGPMVGMILEVQPSDVVANKTSSNSRTKRGWRHECTVMITMNAGGIEPNLILSNVVILPARHSGVDNYEEDLPRGVSTKHLDNKEITEQYAKLDTSRLDGEMCVVDFIGGSIDFPYIQNWWPHPANIYDPATCGKESSKEAGFLKQIDIDKHLTRSMRRVNGVLQLITPEGDIYINTNDANSILEIESDKGKTKGYKRLGKDSGGSIQIDIKPSQQVELNFNDPVEGLKIKLDKNAADKREPSLPHIDQGKVLTNAVSPIMIVPQARSTKKTYVQRRKYEKYDKTSNHEIYCENTESETDGKKGEYKLSADDSVTFIAGKSPDLTTVLITKDKMDVGGTTSEPGILATTFLADLTTYLGGLSDSLDTLITACAAPPLSGLAPGLNTMKASVADFKTKTNAATSYTTTKFTAS